MTLDDFIETFQRYEGRQMIVVQECGSTLPKMWVTELNVATFQGITFANAHLASTGPLGLPEIIVTPEGVKGIRE